MHYKVNGEQFEKRFEINGRKYRVVKHWYYLPDGNKVQYIHAYRGISSLPFKRWMWVTDEDNNFLNR